MTLFREHGDHRLWGAYWGTMAIGKLGNTQYSDAKSEAHPVVPRLCLTLAG